MADLTGGFGGFGSYLLNANKDAYAGIKDIAEGVYKAGADEVEASKHNRLPGNTTYDDLRNNDIINEWEDYRNKTLDQTDLHDREAGIIKAPKDVQPYLRVMFDVADMIGIGIPSAVIDRFVVQKDKVTLADARAFREKIAKEMRNLDIDATSYANDISRFSNYVFNSAGISKMAEYMDRKYNRALNSLDNVARKQRRAERGLAQADEMVRSIESNTPMNFTEFMVGKDDQPNRNVRRNKDD